MARTTYPTYRVSRWLDTSEEAMQKEQATIFYGVETRRCRFGPWLHCHTGGEPLLFDTPAEAANQCAKLTKADVLASERSNV